MYVYLFLFQLTDVHFETLNVNNYNELCYSVLCLLKFVVCLRSAICMASFVLFALELNVILD